MVNKIHSVHAFGHTSISHSFLIHPTKGGLLLEGALQSVIRNNPDKIKRAASTSDTLKARKYFKDGMVQCTVGLDPSKNEVAHCVTQGTSAFDYFNFQMNLIREQHEKEKEQEQLNKHEELQN